MYSFLCVSWFYLPSYAMYSSFTLFYFWYFYFILYYCYYQGGFIFHLILHGCWGQWLVGLRKKRLWCVFFNPTVPLRVVFFPGQLRVAPDTDNTHSEVKPVGRYSGVRWKRLISVNQYRWWVCVRWEKRGSVMLMATET